MCFHLDQEAVCLGWISRFCLLQSFLFEGNIMTRFIIYIMICFIIYIMKCLIIYIMKCLIIDITKCLIIYIMTCLIIDIMKYYVLLLILLHLSYCVFIATPFRECKGFYYKKWHRSDLKISSAISRQKKHLDFKGMYIVRHFMYTRAHHTRTL